MKQILTLVTALFTSLTLSAAERVAPTLPDFVTLESGKDYYLYNVGSQGFLAPLSSNTSYSGINSTSGLKASITMLSEGCYTVQFKESGYYWYSTGTSIIIDYSWYQSEYCSWNFIPTSNENEYNIQVTAGKQYYNATQYVGTKSNEEQVYSNLTSENNITWKLIDCNAGEMYCARVRLYNALEAMNGSGYHIAKFEDVYTNANSTIEDIDNATKDLIEAKTLTSKYTFPEWNEVDFLLIGKSSNISIENPVSAYFKIDSPAILSFIAADRNFNVYTDYLKVTLDGTDIQSIYDNQLRADKRHFIELQPGEHTIQWSGICSLEEIGIETTEQISVNLLEPGSLGNEILYNVSHLKDVHCLKIKGAMNDDDWNKIKMMKENLYTLDLSEANITNIPASIFNSSPFLYSINLPEGLKTIGDNAFNSSNLKEVNFPSTLESIGYRAFATTCITSAILPEQCLNLGDDIFYFCKFLTETKLPDNLLVIPHGMYNSCEELNSFVLPVNLTTIESYAFYGARRVSFDFPESLKSIGYVAFQCTNRLGEKSKLIIPKNVTSIEKNAFADCLEYVYAELPTTIYNVSDEFLPKSIKTLRLNSPTVVTTERILESESAAMRAEITVQVPSFLVNAYKLDDYWYTYKDIEGFSTEEVNQWVIHKELVLGARDRMLGTPSIIMGWGGALKINGEDAMSINNLYYDCSPYENQYSRIISNADGVIVNGGLRTNFYLPNTGFWYYLSLPYDIKINDIKINDIKEERAQCAVRYYDGASRATNGASGNWKNYNADDIIPAGTGFIIQVSKAGWWIFDAQENDSKQYITSNKMFVKELAENPSENPSDRGWNLIGNPYQSWFNIHKLNFTAPITVRNKNNTYSAYSIIDDDYAIAPNQAFFVQRPTEITEISFPLDGRQLTSVIEDQNNSKERDAQMAERLLTDIVVSDGTESDRTRVVINESATVRYDMGSDANKFLSDNNDVPQIYTIDLEGNQYAINERPLANGMVKLGFRCGNAGAYTFSLGRNMSRSVILTDHETGVRVNLAEQDYCFTAEAGSRSARFELDFNDGATSINDATESLMTIETDANGICVKNANGTVEIYTAGGLKVADAANDVNVTLPAGVYVVKSAGQVKKVVVK